MDGIFNICIVDKHTCIKVLDVSGRYIVGHCWVYFPVACGAAHNSASWHQDREWVAVYWVKWYGVGVLVLPVTAAVVACVIAGIHCPVCRTSLIATRFWVVVICPIVKCLTVLEFSFILFDLCLFITIFNFILNYVPIVTFWIFTYHKIWILLIIFCFIWNYWIIYFLTCLEVFWSVVS